MAEVLWHDEPRGTPPPFEQVYWRYAPLMFKIATKKFGIAGPEAQQLIFDIFAVYVMHAEEVENLAGYFIGSMCCVARKHLGGDAADVELSCGEVPCAATPTEEILRELEQDAGSGSV